MPPEQTPNAAPPAPRGKARKPWWHSKVLWFNLVCALSFGAEASMGLLQPALPINAYAVLAFVLGVGNAVLRVFTSQALARHTVEQP